MRSDTPKVGRGEQGDQERSDPAARAAALVSAAHGRIEQVLFTIPYWVFRYGHQPEIRPYRVAFEALLAGLPAGAEIVVATQAEAVGAAEACLLGVGRRERARVVSLSNDRRFTVWAQDAALARRVDDGTTELVAPGVFPRYDDAEVLLAVASTLTLDVVPTELFFQGGNVLVGDDFWLIGGDTLRETVALGGATDVDDALGAMVRHVEPTRRPCVLATSGELPESTTRPLHGDIEDRLDRSTWKEAIHTGRRAGSAQPIFDLDAFVSLAGRDPSGAYCVLVGDPALAAEITGDPLPDHAVRTAFDEIAASLADEGFVVTRNPLPLVHHDDKALRTRSWYFASGNNAVVEIDGADRRVWVPTYGDSEYPQLRVVDQENEKIWRNHGFSVDLLPSFHVFARGLGAARCVTKVLARAIETPGAAASR